jgi:hypothetical protein
MRERVSDEIRLEMRIKNNKLYEAIVEPFGTVAEFSRRSGLSQSLVGGLINFTKSPFYQFNSRKKVCLDKPNNNGVFNPRSCCSLVYTSLAKRLAEIAGYSCEELFPIYLYKSVTSNFVVRTLSLNMLIESRSRSDSLVASEQNNDDLLSTRLVVPKVLETLSPREQFIIEGRFGISKGYALTLEEMAKITSLTIERVRQIEAKAIRRLRHPTRSRALSGGSLKELPLPAEDKDQLYGNYDVEKFFRGDEVIRIEEILDRYGSSNKQLILATRALGRFYSRCAIKFDGEQDGFVNTDYGVDVGPGTLQSINWGKMSIGFRKQVALARFLVSSKVMKPFGLTRHDGSYIRKIARTCAKPSMTIFGKFAKRYPEWWVSKRVVDRERIYMTMRAQQRGFLTEPEIQRCQTFGIAISSI